MRNTNQHPRAHPEEGSPGKGFWLVLCGLALLLGCATETKHKLLTFFFDGIPQPGASTNAAPAPTNNASAISNALAQAQVAALASRPPMITHPPYDKQQCTSCHESAFSQKMRGKPG